ncbi:MAG: hypothetical protein MZU97_04000 [Bacillus subtilis]|nr:hypothetical protein [Bacillus subtilis]
MMISQDPRPESPSPTRIARHYYTNDQPRRQNPLSSTGWTRKPPALVVVAKHRFIKFLIAENAQRIRSNTNIKRFLTASSTTKRAASIFRSANAERRRY